MGRIKAVRSTEARIWRASHDMLLGLHLVGHGNGTEVFNQRRDMMTSVFWEGDLGTDGGGALGGSTAPLKGHCNCLSNRTGVHREPRLGEGGGMCISSSLKHLLSRPLKLFPSDS